MKTNISFSLSSALTINTIETLAPCLRQLSLTASEGVTLDASEVKLTTTPGLQLLHALQASLSTSGREFQIHGADATFVHVCSETGFDHLLQP